MAIPPFRATVAEIGDEIGLVSVSGELDLYVEADVRAALDTARSLNAPKVVVDLSSVTFMDSTVCGVLVAESRRRHHDGGELVLVSNGLRTSRVLQVSGIDGVVRVYGTLHAAFEDLLLEVVA